MKTTRDLLKAWIEARESVIYEWSGNSTRDITALIIEAKEYCNDLGIPWDDSYISLHAWDVANDYE